MYMLILEKEKLQDRLICLYNPTSIDVWLDNRLFWELRHKFITTSNLGFVCDTEIKARLKDEIRYHETHQRRNRR